MTSVYKNAIACPKMMQESFGDVMHYELISRENDSSFYELCTNCGYIINIHLCLDPKVRLKLFDWQELLNHAKSFSWEHLSTGESGTVTITKKRE